MGPVYRLITPKPAALRPAVISCKLNWSNPSLHNLAEIGTGAPNDTTTNILPSFSQVVGLTGSWASEREVVLNGKLEK